MNDLNCCHNVKNTVYYMRGSLIGIEKLIVSLVLLADPSLCSDVGQVLSHWQVD